MVTLMAFIVMQNTALGKFGGKDVFCTVLREIYAKFFGGIWFGIEAEWNDLNYEETPLWVN